MVNLYKFTQATCNITETECQNHLHNPQWAGINSSGIVESKSALLIPRGSSSATLWPLI